MKNFHLYFLLLFGTLIRDNFACELLFDEDVPFFVSEVDESYSSDLKLPDSLPIKMGYDERIDIIDMGNPHGSAAWVYVSMIINREERRIDFFLLKNLSDYRMENWEPSVESDFKIYCSGQYINFTHLLLIKDENLYEPVFDAPVYNGLLSYSKIHGLNLVFNSSITTTSVSSEDDESNRIGIKIKDSDFNPKHADVTVHCNGSDCEYFDFQAAHKTFDRGYNFDTHIVMNYELLKVDAKDGQYLSFEIIANDSLNVGKAQVNIYVSIEEPIVGEYSGFPVLPVAIGGGMALLLLLICSATLAYYVLRSRKSKNIVRKLTEAEIREFLEGTPSLSGDIGKRSVDVNTPIMAMPYNQAFEIPRERLRIDETTILGTGAFGVVWKGSVVFSNGEGMVVAVKSIKRNVGVLYFKALLSELKIMAYIGKHPNIVSLVGACTHNIRKREVYIAVQYCSNGNFHNYLKCRRDRFSNLVVDGTLQLTNAAAYTYMYPTKGIFFKSLSTMDLLRWATQIANGLQYLESLGVIHGDLATRNILLDNNKMAKIGDFGLSRRLIDYNYSYTKTTQAPLPWKWMAPESLRDMKFSKKSDIWSFGIVLWEIFTLSQTPYPGQNWDEGFIDKLEEGMRPKKPAFATFELYQIMTDCWNLDPFNRPAILDIKRTLEETTNTTLRQSNDSSYMRFMGEKPFITMLNEDKEEYLQPIDENRADYMEC